MNDFESVVFPHGLLDWAGHRLGGVRRLFHDLSGRPAGKVIRTRLLDRLANWATSLAGNRGNIPRVILLVGGPGNGKTEAVEHSIEAVDLAFGARGEILTQAREKFDSLRHAPQRIVSLSLGSVSTEQVDEVVVVQDASGGSGSTLSPPAELVNDLSKFAIADSRVAYLACVNRGVLDDALIYAIDNKLFDAAQLIERIIQSVGIAPGAPSCWPLEGYPVVGVWPMDVESLVDKKMSDGDPSPAEQLIEQATDESRWPRNDCPAGDRCPFCTSRRLLAVPSNRESLLRILRWYEFATGKRWTFRDLFSLFSYLLAGVPRAEKGQPGDPCEWAAAIGALVPRPGGKQESLRLAAPFVLASAQYQQALFPVWPRERIRALRRELGELGLDSHVGLMGFYYFVAMNRGLSLPGTLDGQLHDLCNALDPALADPDLEVSLSAQTRIKLRELDVRFSRSVSEGFHFVRKYHCLSVLETDVLQRLAEADQRLSEYDVVNKRPATAARLQLLLRDFACRFVRRSLGTRSGVVRDKQTLDDFQLVVDGDLTLVNNAAKQVETLLNDRERFLVALNTTFGEAVPPEQRRATLATDKQKVKPRQVPVSDRPDPSIRFLGIGASDSNESIPLTFELYRSMRELRQGLIRASLPRAVVALLDTTRAKLAGKVVRDEQSLDDSEIRIGNTDDVILRNMQEFVVIGRDADHEL